MGGDGTAVRTWWRCVAKAGNGAQVETKGGSFDEARAVPHHAELVQTWLSVEDDPVTVCCRRERSCGGEQNGVRCVECIGRASGRAGAGGGGGGGEVARAAARL